MKRKISIEEDNLELSLELNYDEESFFDGTWMSLMKSYATLLKAHGYISKVLDAIIDEEYDYNKGLE